MTVIQHPGSVNLRAASAQTYARMAGVLFLVSAVGGGFGEFYAPSLLLVPGDAAATAHNLIASDLLFRLGFLGYLAEAVCDVALTFVLYVLLRPVHAHLAQLAVLFRIMATATFAFGELFYFAPSLILGGDGYLKTFSSEQLQALALLSLNVYGAASGIFTVFYGTASIIFGYLIMRSGYLPRVLGALLAIGGLGFVTRNILLLLAPTSASSLLLAPTVLAVLFLATWLLVRGVDMGKGKEHGATAAYGSVPNERSPLRE